MTFFVVCSPNAEYRYPTANSQQPTATGFTWLALALTLVMCLSACGGSVNAGRPLTHLTLWLDYSQWGAHVPLYVAQSKGYFRREGIDISIRLPANVSDPLSLVADQSNTVGIGYMSDVVSAEAKGVPVESIGALVQHHLNCIMTLKSSGITSPTQLAGKTMGDAETPADEVILDTVYRHAHVSGKVKEDNVGFDYVQALLQHRVDAIEGGYQVWERIELEQRGAKVNVIQLQNWGVPDEYELVMLAGRSMVAHSGSTLRRFMKAVSLGEKFAVRRPDAAIRIFLNDNPDFKSDKGPQLVSQSWHLLIPFVQPKGVEFASQSPARWRHLATWMYRNHLVPKMIPNRKLFTNNFLYSGAT